MCQFKLQFILVKHFVLKKSYWAYKCVFLLNYFFSSAKCGLLLTYVKSQLPTQFITALFKNSNFFFYRGDNVDLYIVKEHFKAIPKKKGKKKTNKICRSIFFFFSQGRNFTGQVLILRDFFNFPRTSLSSHLFLAF